MMSTVNGTCDNTILLEVEAEIGVAKLANELNNETIHKDSSHWHWAHFQVHAHLLITYLLREDDSLRFNPVAEWSYDGVHHIAACIHRID